MNLSVKDSLVYVIKGDPIALARPRFGRQHIFDSQKMQKLVLGIEIRNQHKDNNMYTGPLELRVVFYMPVPNYKKSKECKLVNAYHIFTPDLSNMIKFIEDIASELLFKDDCTIAKINATKIYGVLPRTEFSIIPLSKYEED